MFKILRNDIRLSVLLGVLFFAFLLGGASREDVASLAILRPLSMMVLAYAIVFMPREAWQANRGLVSIAGAWVLLIALQLVPLPPAIWHSFPGRELAIDVDRAAGLASQWRPISLVPYRTLNALYATALPLAVLLLALSIPRKKLDAVVFLLIAAGVISAVLGLLQLIGGTGNAFYTYRITNPESAVGLFANRNHNAIMLALLFPLVAAAVSVLPVAREQVRYREWIAGSAAIMVVPFILATQSRAGAIVAVMAIGLAVWTYSSPATSAQKRREANSINPQYLFGSAAIIAIVGVTMLSTATNAIQRLFEFGNADDELRLQIWGPITRMVIDYFPIGSGFGTFPDVYAVAEPAELLQPSYINHAHNDLLEVLLTGGIPALILLALFVALVGKIGLSEVRKEMENQRSALRRLGFSILAILALGSLYDYPLRTPIMATVWVLAIVWAIGRDSSQTARP